MSVSEKIQILVDTSMDIMDVYEKNLLNEQIGSDLRALMYLNKIMLGNMVDDFTNLQMFDQRDPDIVVLNENLFLLFDECVKNNTKIFNRLYEVI